MDKNTHKKKLQTDDVSEGGREGDGSRGIVRGLS